MLLSIIIPVYKAEATLDQCVDSVLREAPLDSEIILVDDGSPDRCPEICDEYVKKDNRVKVIHQENSGASVARNTGLKQAIGDFVFFLDSDDYITDGYFNKLLSHDADLVLGNFVAFYNDGTPNYYLDVSATNEIYDLSGFLRDFHIYFPTIFNFPWGRIYKRSILTENNILFDSSIAINEDLLFNLSYYSHCKIIAFEKDAVVMYRQMSGSLSRRYYLDLFDWYLKGYTEILEMLILQNALTDENKKHFYARFLGNTMECIIGLIKTGSGERKQQLKNICENDLMKTALSYTSGGKLKPIIWSIRKKNILLLIFNVKMYLFALQIKKKTREFFRWVF